MSRKKDCEMQFMTKDLIHFDLCGTDGYKERIETIKAAQEKLEQEIMEKAVGSNYKVRSQKRYKQKVVMGNSII